MLPPQPTLQHICCHAATLFFGQINMRHGPFYDRWGPITFAAVMVITVVIYIVFFIIVGPKASVDGGGGGGSGSSGLETSSYEL